MRKIPVLILVVIVCLVIICGCTVPSSPSPQAPSAPSQPVVVQSAAPVSNGQVKTVSIIASSFDPAIVNIQAGTTVRWVNEDKKNHRVEHLPELPGDKRLFQSEPLSPGQSFSYVFSQPGRYEYGDPQQAGGRTALVIVS